MPSISAGRDPSAAKVQAGFSPFTGFSFLAPHLSPLRSGFLCRTPGKYNRVQSSRRSTRNFSVTILHEKYPMKVKRHGIQPHRCVSALEEKKKKREKRRKVKPDLPTTDLMELMVFCCRLTYSFRARISLRTAEFSKASRKSKSMSLDTQLRFYQGQLMFLLLLTAIVSKSLSEVLRN